MDGKWSLDALYSGYDDPQYAADMRRADVLSEQINAFANTLKERSAWENLLAVLPLLEQEAELYDKLFSFCMLKQSANTADAQSASYIGRLNQKISSTAKAKTVINQYIAGIEELDTLIAEEPLLSEYAYYLRCIREDAKYLLNDAVEEALAKYSMSGGDAWSDLQAYVTSSVKAEYNGEMRTLSALRNLAYDADPAVRRAAYTAELACYEQIKDAAAFALNSIKLQTISECELRIRFRTGEDAVRIPYEAGNAGSVVGCHAGIYAQFPYISEGKRKGVGTQKRIALAGYVCADGQQ